MGAVIILEGVSEEYLETETWIKRIQGFVQEGAENSPRFQSTILRFS